VTGGGVVAQPASTDSTSIAAAAGAAAARGTRPIDVAATFRA
jgi:hypothetical protein